MVSSGRKKFRAAAVLAAVTVVTVTILNMTTTRSSSRNHDVASGPYVLTVTRVVSKFDDCVRDGAQSVLPSESSGEVVLSVRDGFVLERGAVGEASTGVVFAISGGCCLGDARVYLVRLCGWLLLVWFCLACDKKDFEMVFFVLLCRSSLQCTQWYTTQTTPCGFVLVRVRLDVNT